MYNIKGGKENKREEKKMRIYKNASEAFSKEK
jgi:hypothetical protein